MSKLQLATRLDSALYVRVVRKQPPPSAANWHEYDFWEQLDNSLSRFDQVTRSVSVALDRQLRHEQTSLHSHI